MSNQPLYQLYVRSLLHVVSCVKSSGMKTCDTLDNENVSAAPECLVLQLPNTMVSSDEETDTDRIAELGRKERDSVSKVRMAVTDMTRALEEIEKKEEEIFTLNFHIIHSSGSVDREGCGQKKDAW